MDTPELEPLSASLDLQFDYTRSVGPIIGRFLGALRSRRIVGVRGSDGRVHVPPVEYDPVTAAPLAEFVEVAGTGTVKTWSWVPNPGPEHPLAEPFAFALIQLDGADTSILHAVSAPGPEAMSTGMRVKVRWAAETVGHINDIACFEPGELVLETASSGDLATFLNEAAIKMIVTPIELNIQHSVSAQESSYLRALGEGRIIGARCPATDKIYVPPRGASPTHGLPTTDEVELSDHGTVTTFCIVNVPFPGQRIKPPYVAAYVLLDGADIPFLHLILGIDADQVRMGMRVRAVWKPREEWGMTGENITHYEPNGEPDAAFDTYSLHL